MDDSLRANLSAHVKSLYNQYRDYNAKFGENVIAIGADAPSTIRNRIIQLFDFTYTSPKTTPKSTKELAQIKKSLDNASIYIILDDKWYINEDTHSFETLFFTFSFAGDNKFYIALPHNGNNKYVAYLFPYNPVSNQLGPDILIVSKTNMLPSVKSPKRRGVNLNSAANKSKITHMFEKKAKEDADRLRRESENNGLNKLDV